MHSIVSRINNVSALLSSCMMALLAAIAISSFVFTADPKGDLGLASVKVYPATGAKKSTRQTGTGFCQFQYLRPLFHWNTKQLFVWVEAEFNNTKKAENAVVIWDRIIRRKEDANLKVTGKNKYMLRELTKSFKNAGPAHYSLKYNLMPWVGVLTYGEAARTDAPVEFPPVQQRV
ncbi:hypothetical protein NP233_g7181 [Leucocoprinus birnbaumii]|uniref:Signal peptidase subunit 3 n=1 Tax=Leucocoprinus birnbaumii TaxID=56174 RepID=A0AAD5VV65_9AGAR|nr:hypothetical protein NP233_g7181 [Leucocoprinus birnbaumii]